MGRSREKILTGIEGMLVNLNMLNETKQPLIILSTLNHYSSLVIYKNIFY